MPELICKLLHIGKTTYYKYLKEGYPIISFLLSFQKSELEELLLTGKISKFNHLMQIEEQVLSNNAKKYINTFLQKTNSNSLKYASPFFIDFYFNFLSNFHEFDYQEKFSTLVSNFFINYVIRHQEPNKLKHISSYIYLFDDWDELMSIFLNKNIESNLSILLFNSDFQYTNKIAKKEIYFHIIGLYVYRQYPSLNSLLKIELIKNLHDSVQDEFYTYYLLIQHINEVELERINSLKELGFDKSLY